MHALLVSFFPFLFFICECTNRRLKKKSKGVNMSNNQIQKWIEEIDFLLFKGKEEKHLARLIVHYLEVYHWKYRLSQNQNSEWTCMEADGSYLMEQIYLGWWENGESKEEEERLTYRFQIFGHRTPRLYSFDFNQFIVYDETKAKNEFADLSRNNKIAEYEWFWFHKNENTWKQIEPLHISESIEDEWQKHKEKNGPRWGYIYRSIFTEGGSFTLDFSEMKAINQKFPDRGVSIKRI
jgi:hypothetical protein